MMSAAASLGLSLLWDTDLGLTHIDKYTYSSEEYIKVDTHFLSNYQPDVFPRPVHSSPRVF